MKKYKISKRYIGVLVGSIVFLLFGFVFFLYLAIKLSDILSIVIAAICLITIICTPYLYYSRASYVFGYFCIDAAGITMNLGRKKYFHPWEKIVDYGFVNVKPVNDNMLWLYFSERLLSFEEKRGFLIKTRHDLNSIAFFEYNPGTFFEIISVIPENIAKKLLVARGIGDG